MYIYTNMECVGLQQSWLYHHDFFIFLLFLSCEKVIFSIDHNSNLSQVKTIRKFITTVLDLAYETEHGIQHIEAHFHEG